LATRRRRVETKGDRDGLLLQGEESLGADVRLRDMDRLDRFVRRWSWLLAVAAAALVIAVLTVVVGVVLTDGYRDSLHRWTAWAAILAGATVVIAVLGLPVALYQLATVRGDLNRVTRASEFEQGLDAFLLEGVDLWSRFQVADSPEMRTEFAGWVEVVAQYIRQQTGNEVEEKLFRLDAQSLPPRDQVEKKILHLRDDLIPRVRAGYV
jgi:hypothetical protein